MKLKAELKEAALALFVEGGLDAISIRAVAERVGVSTMTPYRYFDDKADLLGTIWENTIQALYATVATAIKGTRGGRARITASVEAFLHYWETHPDEYRLMHQTQHGAHRIERSGADQAPIYGQLLALVRRDTEAFAAELGAGLQHAKLAEDVRIAMQLGYLLAALVNRRYPWGELAVLRATCVRQIVASVEHCLLEGPAQPRRQPKPL